MVITHLLEDLKKNISVGVERVHCQNYQRNKRNKPAPDWFFRLVFQTDSSSAFLLSHVDGTVDHQTMAQLAALTGDSGYAESQELEHMNPRLLVRWVVLLMAIVDRVGLFGGCVVMSWRNKAIREGVVVFSDSATDSSDSASEMFGVAKHFMFGPERNYRKRTVAK